MYMFFNNLTYVAGNSAWWITQIEYFVPVFMAWLFIGFFETDLMKDIFAMIVTLSILGPFAQLWNNLGTFYLAGEGSYLDNVTFWLWFAAYSCYTIFQMIVDIILLPSVFDWAGSDNTIFNADMQKWLVLARWVTY